MAAGPWQIFNAVKAAALNSALDLEGSPLTVKLVDSDYVFDASHVQVSDLGGNTLSGNGYADETVTGVASGTTTRVIAGNSDAVFTASGGSLSPEGVVICQGTQLIAYSDLEDGGSFPTITDGSDLTVDLTTTGILQLA